MLRNYFTTALRHLTKHKGTTLINILGLVLGIASTLIIVVVVRYEQSFDSFHSQADRIYRVVRTGAGENTEYRTGVSYPLTEAIRHEVSGLQHVAAVQNVGEVQVGIYDEKEGVIKNRIMEKQGFALVEPSFFDIFDFQDSNFAWIAGDPATALTEPFSLVLTASMADKYFPDGNALGKRLNVGNQVDFKITGILADLPANTDFPFFLIGSYATMKAYAGDQMNDWYGVSDENQCFVLLQESVSPLQVEAQIKKVHALHVNEEFAAERLYPLQAIREMHTDARFGNFRGRTVSQETLSALIVIGFFLLLTACINFVNLSTAQAVLRSKEVGIRKVMGSKRGQLVAQFLAESFILTIFAALLAMGVAELAVLLGGDLLHLQKEGLLLHDPVFVALLALLVAVVSLSAGLYPALVQSGFHPIAAIKNKITGHSRQSVRLRSGLVVLQFVISQVFIIATLVVIQQMEYFKNADLGFEKEAVVNVFIPENKQDLQALKNQWEQNSAIAQVSFASTRPSGLGRNTSHWDIRRKSAPEESIVFEYQSVDEQYLDLYSIALLAGRNFVPADTAKSIILNEKLALQAGFTSAQEAIGEEMLVEERAFTIIGVTENFHTKSLREEIDYVALVMQPNRYSTASLKLNLSPSDPQAYENLKQTISSIEEPWTATFPDFVFEYQFLDQTLEAYYREEARLSQLFKLLAGITIFIGCLGLYGLVTFMAVRRTKEVGVRKVLGASIQHILLLFSREFVYLILLAFCLAAPLAWYIMNLWLQIFTYKIELSIGIFLLAMLTSLSIAVITVSYQSLKAATANPVDSLRSE
jgi:putative ABC transport system permease protein